MNRTLRLMDDPAALPSGGGTPPLPDTAWMNTNSQGLMQGFEWLASSPEGLRARGAGTGIDLVWEADTVIRYGGIATPELVAFSATRKLADSEVLLQGNLNLGLLVLATYEIPHDPGPGYFSREFFARRRAAPEAGFEPSGQSVFGHLEQPSTVDTAPLLGRWRNTDAAGHGLLEMIVEDLDGELSVRALGSGEPDPVDWGPGKTRVFACLDEAGNASLSALATWDFGFLETQLQLRVPGGTLAVAGFNVFKDGSGRPGYSTREFFYRT